VWGLVFSILSIAERDVAGVDLTTTKGRSKYGNGSRAFVDNVVTFALLGFDLDVDKKKKSRSISIYRPENCKKLSQDTHSEQQLQYSDDKRYDAGGVRFGPSNEPKFSKGFLFCFVLHLKAWVSTLTHDSKLFLKCFGVSHKSFMYLALLLFSHDFFFFVFAAKFQGEPYNIEIKDRTPIGLKYDCPSGKYRVLDRKCCSDLFTFYLCRKELLGRFGHLVFFVNPNIRRYAEANVLKPETHQAMVTFIERQTTVAIDRYYIPLCGMFLPNTFLSQIGVFQSLMKYDRQISIIDAVALCRGYYKCYKTKQSSAFKKAVEKLVM